MYEDAQLPRKLADFSMTVCCLDVPASGLVRLCQGRGRGEAAAGSRFEHPGVRGSPHRVKGIAEVLSYRTLA